MNKILVVDDDPGALGFIKHILEEGGYAVSVASDAPSAISAFRESPPDLLLLDLDIPGGGGEHVFEELYGGAACRIPVLFITGTAGRVDVDLSVTKVAVLRKPPGAANLLAHVAHMLKQPHAGV